MMLFMTRTASPASTSAIVSGRTGGRDRACPTESSSRAECEFEFRFTSTIPPPFCVRLDLNSDCYATRLVLPQESADVYKKVVCPIHRLHGRPCLRLASSSIEAGRFQPLRRA